MNDKLQQVLNLARRTGGVSLATADARGTPHVAAAGRVEVDEQGHLAVSEWFCPRTVSNLDENRAVALVAWDAATDEGLQVVGTVREVQDFAVMDGYEPGVVQSLPQVQRRLIIQPERITAFRRGPHSDQEE